MWHFFALVMPLLSHFHNLLLTVTYAVNLPLTAKGKALLDYRFLNVFSLPFSSGFDLDSGYYLMQVTSLLPELSIYLRQHPS